MDSIVKGTKWKRQPDFKKGDLSVLKRYFIRTNTMTLNYFGQQWSQTCSRRNDIKVIHKQTLFNAENFVFLVEEDYLWLKFL